jgi:hypothetical protein
VTCVLCQAIAMKEHANGCRHDCHATERTDDGWQRKCACIHDREAHGCQLAGCKKGCHAKGCDCPVSVNAGRLASA